MSYGDKDEFHNIKQEQQIYADGTVVPHLSFEVWRNGIYRGYCELHTHKVSDNSISVGMTSRLETLKKP